MYQAHVHVTITTYVQQVHRCIIIIYVITSYEVSPSLFGVVRPVVAALAEVLIRFIPMYKHVQTQLF